VERVVKAHLNMGITELARVMLKETSLPMTATDLKERIEARKLDLSRYSNPLAVIHTVLKRLVQSGEVKVVPQKYGKKAYQWVSTTEKLLSELRQPRQPAAQQREGLEAYGSRTLPGFASTSLGEVWVESRNSRSLFLSRRVLKSQDRGKAGANRLAWQ
jgi:hypothetical protein